MFSDSEVKLLTFIGRKPISLATLTDLYYDGDPPFEGGKRVAGMVNRITAKLEASCSEWTLASSGGGRAGKKVWRENV